ncbi:MAG: FAD-dependent oxidoreductase [Myxococcota bacterium]|nr:FAD-dependent oxidoreductase [Myxococcota bacterium]
MPPLSGAGEGTMTDTGSETHTDALVIGGGHNGLAAAAVLSKQGHSVIVLEKNGYVGGMTGTR